MTTSGLDSSSIQSFTRMGAAALSACFFAVCMCASGCLKFPRTAKLSFEMPSEIPIVILQGQKFNRRTDEFFVLRFDNSSVLSCSPFTFDHLRKVVPSSIAMWSAKKPQEGLHLWTWNESGTDLYFFPELRAHRSVKKLVRNTPGRDEVYSFHGELSFGMDHERLYVIDGRFSLLAVNPQDGQERLLFENVQSFIKHPREDRFWLFDTSGYLRSVDSTGKSLASPKRFSGVFTGAGYLCDGWGVVYRRPHERATGKLLVLDLERNEVAKELSLPQCAFLCSVSADTDQ